MLVKKFKVQKENCYENGKLKLSALQYFMQECASEDSDSYGMTGEQMRQKGMAFVLTRVSLDIYKDISIGDDLEILSVHDHAEGVSLIREFIIVSQNGYCCRATTVWIILNLETRRILRPNSITEYAPTVYIFKEQVESEKHIFAKEEIPEHVTDVKIVKNHIDENGHVNNTYYQDFIALALGNEYADKSISHLQISYVHEAFEGDVLSLSVLTDSNVSRVRAENGGKCCFEAIIRTTEREDGKQL